MSKFRLTLNILALAIFTLTVTSLAQAQTRTWVSGVGDDLNPAAVRPPAKPTLAPSQRPRRTVKSAPSTPAALAQ